MRCYKDRAYCASPHCENKCGRKPDEKELQDAKRKGDEMMFGYFCGEPE